MESFFCQKIDTYRTTGVTTVPLHPPTQLLMAHGVSKWLFSKVAKTLTKMVEKSSASGEKFIYIRCILA